MIESISQKAPTLAEYEIEVYKKTLGKCPDCDGVLGPIQYYTHDGGWWVKGFVFKQWLYKTCRKCGYQWALWKLGVPEIERARPKNRRRRNEKSD